MSQAEYRYTPDNFAITDDMKQDYDQDGFVLIKGLLSGEELKHIETALTEGPFNDHTYGVIDDEGKAAHMILWNHPGVDVTGMVARCEKIAGTCEQILGGEVYHYHTKLMKKPAKVGGKHIWHQDYGYWYNNGCLFPDMMTVFIAVDKCTKENSCLQVLPGSHKCGRIEHISVGGQVGADMERVDQIAKVCPLQLVEMDPGDALFFHCNLLHCSSANLSAKRRWAFLCAYNKATNNPVKEHHHPCYTPLEKGDTLLTFSGDVKPLVQIFKIQLLSDMIRWAFLCAYNKATNNPVKEHHHPCYTPLEKVDNSAILSCTDFTTMDGKWFLGGEEKNPGRVNIGDKADKPE